MNALSKKFREHVEFLQRMADAGCETSARSLAGMALLAEGWRYGDPDPDTPDGDGGGKPIDDRPSVVLLRRAA